MDQLSVHSKKVWKFLRQRFPCNRVLAQRIFKSTVSATVALIFCLIPKVRDRLGNQPAMLPLIAVMVHPGRRISATIQGAMYCITGLLIGLAYSLLGRFVAQRCLGHTWNSISELEQYSLNYRRYESALALLAVFETLMLFVHGWMRSVSHHYFHIVFPLFLVVHFAFMAPLTENAGTIAKAFSVPFYLGIAMSIFWNLMLFPEFGSTYLGNNTMDVLNEIHKSIDSAINFFISIDVKDLSQSLYDEEPISLAKLLKLKSSIDGKVSNCNLVLEECMYEISYSYLSPSDLAAIIKRFDHLSKYISALINACQLEFMLLGRHRKQAAGDGVMLKTEKEIYHADAKKLLKVLKQMKAPIFDLHKTLSQSLFIIKAALAYCFDVKMEIVHTQALSASLGVFGSPGDVLDDANIERSISDLVNGVIEFDLRAREVLIHLDDDLLQPSDEMFLFSSFLMNFKETTNTIIEMMKEMHKIYKERNYKESMGSLRGRTLWINFLRSYTSFEVWLKGATRGKITESQSLTGGTTGQNNRPAADMGIKRPHEEERAILSQRKSDLMRLSNMQHTLPQVNSFQGPLVKSKSIRGVEWFFDISRNLVNVSSFSKILIFCHSFYASYKEHFRFGMQVTVALMLASFPMFIPKTRDWYINVRGTWIGFVCILALEPSVGGTFWVFFLRGVGVILGAAWAYVSYLAGRNQTNPYLEVVVTIFGAIPGFYFLLGTPYVKAAIIQIISIYVVLLAAILPSENQGSILSNFAKRCLAVGYGGGIAVLVQLTMFPVTARDQLSGEVSFVAGCISEMQVLLAAGLEGENLSRSLTDEKYQRFAKISSSAKAALSRASGYKSLTRQEPRLKGNFAEIERAFTQIIYIQRQIIDRMDNVVLLRKQYGSAIVEELNDMVYAYRRQYVASISTLLRAVQEAIRNKTPLPQFLPSARIAHRRLVNRVQNALKSRYATQMRSLRPRVVIDVFQNDREPSDLDEGSRVGDQNGTRNSLAPHEYIMKEKFLSWNASSAAAEEVTEYVEEVVQLTKIIVGVNEFKYGFLSRPLYVDWAAEAALRFDDFVKQPCLDIQKKSCGGNFSAERQESHLQTTTNTELESYDDVSLEEGGPVALDAVSSSDSQMSNSVNLAHIASRKSEVPSLSARIRKRAFSIGSRGKIEHLPFLSKIKTLGHGEMAEFVDIDSNSDEELPLALKKMIFK
ncbi:LADA_0H02476g1_1 [Lachancea dasiensis]|uniref:LADA_0H02476g1_1 n=1 Tax=Lachancea dasiensis TaxID=1072105 RepID=A0A1G4JZY7_9SACH|nr:LADA_0H02476g1_1 [Lachancea dasiensis]